MHEEIPAVYRVPVHLENQHMVYYNADDDPQEVAARGESQQTALTAWFKANRQHEEAWQTTCQNFPWK